MKHPFLVLILFVLALSSMPSRLLAATELNAGRLIVRGTTANDEIQLQVGPAPGEVVVLKAPGVAEGTRFIGVNAILVASGDSFSDKVEIKAELTSDLAITIDTGRGGDEMKLDMKALAGTVNVRVEVLGSSGQNKLEWLVDSAAQALGISLVVNTLAGNDDLVVKIEADEPSARLAVNLATMTGTSDDAVEAVIKSAAAVVDLNVTGDLSAGSDKVKVELDQLTPSQVTANLNVELSGSDDSGEISIKGSNARLTVNGRLSAGQGNDALKLLVEGAAGGTPVLDGGIGQDSCSTTIGTLVACE